MFLIKFFGKNGGIVYKGLCVLLLSTSLLYATAIEELQTLSLEELLEVEVSTVSRRSENPNMAPGVITIVSSQEIEQYGARHLRDVLDRIVGTQVLGSHQDYHSKTSIRGFNSSHHEGHVLLLLNGRPVRQATDGGLNSDFYLGFPLNIIDHIEVVRGPGSVIYGSNAATGVINIITKNGQDVANETRVDLGTGSFDRHQAQATGIYGGIDYNMNIGVNYITADGDTFEGIEDSDGNIGNYEWGQKSKNAVVNGSYKNFTFNGIVMDNELDGANSKFQLPSTPIYLQRYFLDLGYLHAINEAWDISFNYTYQADSADWQISEANERNKSKAHSRMYETIIRGKINEKMCLLMGGNYEDLDSGFEKGLPYSESDRTTVYAQVDYMFSQKQKIIAGVQWNKAKNLSSDYSPRLGFIQGFNENTWLKFLYSQAYRSPTFVETSLNAPALQGNPSIKPEKVETYDIQLVNQTKKSYLALALYHSKLDDLIVRAGTFPDTQENRGYIIFQGIEFEAKYEFGREFSVLGNASYQKNKTDTGIEQSTFAPEVMIKLGGTYGGLNGLRVSVFNSYIGESTDLTKTNGAPNRNPKADAYNMLTANITADTGVLWGVGDPGKSLLSLYLDNILDEDIYAPDLNFAGGNNTIPHHWGFGAYVTYTYKF